MPPMLVKGRGGAVVCPRRKPKGQRSRLTAVFNSPVTRVRLGAPAAFGGSTLYVLKKHNPPQSATDYIALAIEQVMKLIPDTGQLPTRADIEQLWQHLHCARVRD